MTGGKGMIKKNGNVVTFEFDQESQNNVFLAGDFNNWDPKKTPLAQKNGKWQATITLNPGEYQYKYVANNGWFNDANADKYVPNGFGSENSVVIIPEQGKSALSSFGPCNDYALDKKNIKGKAPMTCGKKR